MNPLPCDFAVKERLQALTNLLDSADDAREILCVEMLSERLDRLEVAIHQLIEVIQSKGKLP